MRPSFPQPGTPGYTEWQGAVSSARSYLRVVGADLRPGGTVSVSYDYEFRGLWSGYLCPKLQCTIPFGKPHPARPMPTLSRAELYLGRSGDSQHYGTHDADDHITVAGPWVSRRSPASGKVTEEVAQVVRQTPGNPFYADAHFTIVRRASLVYTLPQDFVAGDYFVGLHNHPFGALAHDPAVSGTPYASGWVERPGWWTAGTLAPLLATGQSGTLHTRDIKVVRFLQVGTRGCLKQTTTITGTSTSGLRKAAAACSFLAFSSNQNPPRSLAGKRWRRFVRSQEFRSFTHVAATSVHCRGGLVAATPATPRGSGISPGWTPVSRLGTRVYTKGEPFADARFSRNQAVIKVSADRSAATITLSQAARLAKLERLAQRALLGYDAPYIWTVVTLEYRCAGRGSFRISTSVSSVPRAAIYVADEQMSTTRQSPHLATFIRSGGKQLQPRGKGFFFAECRTVQIQQEGVFRFPTLPRCAPPVKRKAR